MPWHTYLEKNTVVFFFGEVKIVKVTSTLQCRYWLYLVVICISIVYQWRNHLEMGQIFDLHWSRDYRTWKLDMENCQYVDLSINLLFKCI